MSDAKSSAAKAPAPKKMPMLKATIQYNDSPDLSTQQCGKMNEEPPRELTPKEKKELMDNLKKNFPNIDKGEVRYINGDRGYNCHGFTTGSFNVNNHPNFGGMTELKNLDYASTVRPGQIITYNGGTHSAIQGAGGWWYHKLGEDGPLIATSTPGQLAGGSDWTTAFQPIKVDHQYIPKK